MNTEIVQRVSSIAICDEKDLAQVLAEALDKVSHFEKVTPKLARIEGVLSFFNEWVGSTEYEMMIDDYKRMFKGALVPRITSMHFFTAEKTKEKLLEYTGMSFPELDMEVLKRLGPASFWDNIKYEKHHRIRLSKAKTLEMFLDSYTKEAKELKPIVNEAITEMENSAAMLIPADYRYPLALETMLRFVRNFKAKTWKECADLYDEQLHRWKMEENSEENLRLQREIRNLTGTAAKSATAAAIFSGLNFIFK